MIIQRFKKGHPLFSDVETTNSDPAKGVTTPVKSVFGQIINDKGEFICYSQERLDTLIPCDTYEYGLYDSPHNKLTVIRLIKDSKGTDISGRCLEIHPANFPYELRGCLAPCTSIDIHVPCGNQSRPAWAKVMAMAGEKGTITYEDFE